MSQSHESRIGWRAGAALFTLAAVGLVAGWWLFLFLTDDAYIAFRYASNLLAGHGLVWNPEPFRPVEGYTSLLWVALLSAVWAVLGIEPPVAANVLSLGFGALTLVLTWRLFARLPLPPALAPRRAWLFAIVLLGTLGNRTFLAWLSSGLETAMFNAWVTWFAVEATAPAEGRSARRWPERLALAATLAALTRPEGVLFAGAAAALLAARSFELRQPSALARGWPLLALPLHLVWRRLTYDAWWPNTYYAKVGEAWPESGVRYVASFVVEYGLWVWLLLALVFLATRWPRRAELWRVRGSALLIAALVVHGGYYSLAVGGDHFEYRVLSHLVPLLWVSGVWLAAQLWRRPVPVFAVLGVWWLVSLPLPWAHWAATRDLETRAETAGLFVPLAPRFPAPLAPLVRVWDGWQEWLVAHKVGLRHQEHKVFARHRREVLPTRASGARIPWSQRNVLVESAVGVTGWVLPGVAILDRFGLNDRVVARLPAPPRPEGRLMAHERLAPQAYLDCFAPNVGFVPGERRVRVAPRALPDGQVRSCESRDWTNASRRQFGAD